MICWRCGEPETTAHFNGKECGRITITTMQDFDNFEWVTEKQPVSKPGDEVIFTRVIEDIKTRAEFGKRKHGRYLETNNGRDGLIDAYQEALDLVMYLRQLIAEKDERKTS